MAQLDGVGVLVTRPEHQAAALCALLEARGAITMRLPALQIKPLARPLPEAHADFELMLFTSANAVRCGADLLERRGTSRIAAIGPATARALAELGHEATLKPSSGYTSEALLAHLDLETLAGRRILLVKGAEGRQLLEPELQRRGANVVALEVYERLPATPSAEQLAAVQTQFAARRLQVVTATSLDVGRRLLEIVPETLRRLLLQASWLVPGERVGAGLRGLGIAAPLLTAASAEDQDLVAALLDWRAGASRA